MTETKLKSIEKSEHPCPVCHQPLTKAYGSKMFQGNPAYGITLSCENLKCTPQEVMGHGKTEVRAYEIVMARLTGGKMTVEESTENEQATETPQEAPKQREVVEVKQPVKRGRPAKVRVVAEETEEIPL